MSRPDIHPLACVSPNAELGAAATIGPYCIIEDGARIGDNCSIAGHAIIKSGCRLGNNNTVSEGAVLGGIPQHLQVSDRIGEVVIGDANTIREHVTIHRALNEGARTLVGNNNTVMVGTHIAHDCDIGDNTILANNVLMAGHVTVEDRAFVSGGVAIHQFCRIGAYAMVGGLSTVRQDVPPCVIIGGDQSRVVGLNLIGLKRNGVLREELAQLKQVYRLIYRDGLPRHEMLARLEADFSSGPAARFFPFLSQSQRGIVGKRRKETSDIASIRLHRPLNDKSIPADVRRAG